MNAFRALMEGAIDYAGMFPPASLDFHTALANYRRYREGPHAWMLGRFVAPSSIIAGSGLPPISMVSPDKKSERACDLEYTEIPIISDPAGMQTRAKIRTGGLTPDA